MHKEQVKIVEFTLEEAEAFLKLVDDAVRLLHIKIEKEGRKNERINYTENNKSTAK